MVRVFPFRALHYNPGVVGDLTCVVSQPYDKIDARLRQEYYERHEHHIVRLLLGRDEADDNERSNRYTRARDALTEWLAAGVLVREESPAVYAYRQRYRTASGEKTRLGLTAMVRLEKPGEGSILPHEETHIGPKIDRFKLLNHTRTHFGHIFLLYSDPERTVNTILDRACTGGPRLRAVDDFGELHEAWPLTDPGDIRAIQAVMEPKRAIIADGHHRYETAYKFMVDLDRAGAEPAGSENHRNVLATLVNMDDEGLTLFPTHRIVRGLDRYDFDRLRQGLSDLFHVSPYSPDLRAFERALAEKGRRTPAFGIVDQKAPVYLLASLKDPDGAVNRIPGSRSREWKLLDVNVLHTLVLEAQLGVTPEDLAHARYVDYCRYASEVEKLVRKERTHQVGFLVNPCTVGQIRTLAERGERFPQKTTDFYPKLLSGFLMCRLESPRKGLRRLKSPRGLDKST